MRGCVGSREELYGVFAIGDGESLTITAAVVQIDLGKPSGGIWDLDHICVATTGTSAVTFHCAWVDLGLICRGLEVVVVTVVQ